MCVCLCVCVCVLRIVFCVSVDRMHSANTHTHIHTYIHTHTHTHTYTHTHMRAHIHIRTRAHTHAHSCTQSQAPVGVFPVIHSPKSRCGDRNLMWTRVLNDGANIDNMRGNSASTFALKNSWSGLCLEPTPVAEGIGDGHHAAVSLRQNTCNATSLAQRWALDGDGRLAQAGGGDCLTIIRRS